MNEKINLIKSIFTEAKIEHAGEDFLSQAISEVTGKSTYVQHGKYFGGWYNGKKYFYSEQLINHLPIEKLEKFIKSQINYGNS